MSEKVSCAERLREALVLRNLRQSDLCEITGIPKSAMSQYVSGAFEPKQDRVEAISKALDVNEAWLMGYDVSSDRGGFGALDPILPYNMRSVNLDNAKIGKNFLNNMLATLPPLYKDDFPTYLRVKSSVLDIAKSSGLEKMAASSIKVIEHMYENEEKPTIQKDDGLQELLQEPLTQEILSALQKLSPQAQKIALAHLQDLADLERK